MKANFSSFFFGIFGAMFFNIFFNKMPLRYPAVNHASTISASQINLIDIHGKTRATLGISNEGSPGLFFMDDNNVVRAEMGLYGDGRGFVGLQDKNGNMIQLLRSFGENEVPLHIFKNNATDMMILGLDPQEIVPFSMYYDKNRKRILNFGDYHGP